MFFNGAQHNPSRTGSVNAMVLVAVFVVMLIIFSIGLVTTFSMFDDFRDSIVLRKAEAATDAMAMSAHYFQPEPAYAPAGTAPPKTPGELRTLLDPIGKVNGMFPDLFEPLTEADIVHAGVTFTVTLDARDPEIADLSSAAYGVPAGRILRGIQWVDANGMLERVCGCMPLGVDQTAWNQFPGQQWLVLRDNDNGQTGAASLLDLDGLGLVQQHLGFLAYTPGGPPSALTPPPEVVIGQTLLRSNPTDAVFDALVADFGGRILLLPLLDNQGVVVGFGRARIVDFIKQFPPDHPGSPHSPPGPPTRIPPGPPFPPPGQTLHFIQLEKVASAVEPCAQPLYDVATGSPPPDPSSVPIVGEVLHTRRGPWTPYGTIN